MNGSDENRGDLISKGGRHLVGLSRNGAAPGVEAMRRRVRGRHSLVFLNRTSARSTDGEAVVAHDRRSTGSPQGVCKIDRGFRSAFKEGTP